MGFIFRFKKVREVCLSVFMINDADSETKQVTEKFRGTLMSFTFLCKEAIHREFFV